MAHDRGQTPERERPAGFEQVTVLLRALSAADKRAWEPPRSPEELHERVCLAAVAVGADVETLYRETAAEPFELGRWLRYVETRKDLLAAYGKHAVRNAEAPLLKCARCGDRAYVESLEIRGYETVTFCSCEAGLAAEAGTWARLLHGNMWQKFRLPTEAMKKSFEAYIRRRGCNEFDLRRRIKEAEKRRGRAGKKDQGELA